MKLLGWMHRKFRQNTSETSKDYSIGYTGQPSMDDLQWYPKGSYGSKPLNKAQREKYRRNSFTSLEAAREDHDEDLEEEPSPELAELFHGFLAIGTLGTDQPMNTDIPATPTFSISVDHIAEKETEVTENELKLINDELEKVLGDDSCNASSGRNSHVSAGRNSHVSAGRISHCSTITLSGTKPIESGENVCPLQSYLFGSTIGLPEAAQPLRKEQRTSLGELFQKTKQAEENYSSGGHKSDKGSKRMEKETDKSAVHLVKKMLKKKIIHANSTTTETKLHKILHIFNRKVHPENSTSCHQGHKATKNQMKNTGRHSVSSNGGGLRPSTEDIIIYPQHGKEGCWSYKTKGIDDTTGNEFWVKTDQDYLVLEL